MFTYNGFSRLTPGRLQFHGQLTWSWLAIAATPPDWDAEDATFGYDANGNLISQTGKFSDIAYDHRNLLVHFYLDSGDEVIANYADGQRILKELKGEAWQFYVMDGQQTLAVIDNEGFSHF